MRIAFLHQPNDPYTENRIRCFISKGYEVYSIVFPLKKELYRESISSLTTIKLESRFYSRIPFFKRFIYYRELRSIINDNSIDILYIVNALNSFYLWTSTATHNFLELEGSDVILAPKKYPFLKLFYRKFWKYSDGIVQDSQVVMNKSKLFLPEGKSSEIIGIGIDTNLFNRFLRKGNVREKYHLGDRPVVFHSRSTKALYNVDIIIRSIPLVKKHIHDVCYLLTGNYQSIDKKTKQFIIQEKLEDHLIFCGYLDHISQIKYYYADSNVVLSVPSSDSSPFSVFEAMATGIPVITTNLTWFKNIFEPGRHLITVPVRDVQSLSEAIINVLSGKVKTELTESCQIVFDRMNMIKENDKLDDFIRRAIDKKQRAFSDSTSEASPGLQIMKVLVVCSGNAKGFDFEKHMAFVFDQVIALKREYPQIDFEYYYIKGKGAFGYLRNLSNLKKKIREYKPAFVHAHGGHIGILCNLQRMVPVVTTFHGSFTMKSPWNLLPSLVAYFSHSGIYVSAKLKEKMLFEGKHSYVIPCGVDPDLFYPVDKAEAHRLLGFPEPMRYVLFCSFFENKDKLIQLARKAMKSFPGLILMELKNRTREEVNLLINGAELLLLTSKSEGSPQTVKEAMACNIPIVSNDVGDVRNVIKDTEGTFICSYDPKDVAEKIKLALDFGKRTNGRERILKLGLDNKVIAGRVLEVYQEAMKTGDRGRRTGDGRPHPRPPAYRQAGSPKREGRIVTRDAEK
jgi:glycosyltransferase involved in cell wall biosynthesis